jgi:hypothetical protein
MPLNRQVIERSRCCAWKKRTPLRVAKDRRYYIIRNDERELITVRAGSKVYLRFNKDGEPFLEE